MRVDAFDFELPEHLIALRPADPRGASRLLCVDPDREPAISDAMFEDLPGLLRKGDALVFNDTRVIPARLTGRRVGRGTGTPKIEVTLHKRLDGHRWAAFAKPARKLEAGDRIEFAGPTNTCFATDLNTNVAEKRDGGELVLAFDYSGAVLDESVAAHGIMPLPPYIASRRTPDIRDEEDYQTVYAAHDGAVAAPTAGLHFTDAMLERIRAAGVTTCNVTLHVGAGTFLPVKADHLADHRMHAEWGEVSGDVARHLNDVREAGGRIVAVGTTSLRLLESCLDADGAFNAFSGDTDIFIHPGKTIRSADLLITNFHLPRSTLFMLVCAFCGTGLMQDAYARAIDNSYRFYSYGDACLLKRLDNCEPTDT